MNAMNAVIATIATLLLLTVSACQFDEVDADHVRATELELLHVSAEEIREIALLREEGADRVLEMIQVAGFTLIDYTDNMPYFRRECRPDALACVTAATRNVYLGPRYGELPTTSHYRVSILLHEFVHARQALTYLQTGESYTTTMTSCANKSNIAASLEAGAIAHEAAYLYAIAPEHNSLWAFVKRRYRAYDLPFGEEFQLAMMGATIQLAEDIGKLYE